MGIAEASTTWFPTVDALPTLHEGLEPSDQTRLFEVLWDTYRAEPLVSKQVGHYLANVHAVILRAALYFGPADEFIPRILGDVQTRTPRDMEDWTKIVCPQLEYCVSNFADR